MRAIGSESKVPFAQIRGFNAEQNQLLKPVILESPIDMASQSHHYYIIQRSILGNVRSAMRIQIEIDEKGAEFLQRLRKLTGVQTHKELFNNAITILNWAVQQKRAGRTVASLDEQDKNYKELSMPILDRVAAEVPAAQTARAAV